MGINTNPGPRGVSLLHLKAWSSWQGGQGKIEHRVQTKPGYQEPERNQEAEYFWYQEPERNQEDLDFKNRNQNQNQERNQEFRPKFLVQPGTSWIDQ